jgi:hypothetical protein
MGIYELVIFFHVKKYPRLHRSRRHSRCGKYPGTRGRACIDDCIDAGRHEMTHAVHIGMGSFSGGWIRSVGTTVLTEGLAMRVTQRLNPALPDAKIIWRTAILKDLQAALNSSTPDDVQRYTFSKGQAGIEREGYYAGWLVVGYWLDQGMRLGDIAHISEAQMPARVGEAIQKLLAEPVPTT